MFPGDLLAQTLMLQTRWWAGPIRHVAGFPVSEHYGSSAPSEAIDAFVTTCSDNAHPFRWRKAEVHQTTLKRN